MKVIRKHIKPVIKLTGEVISIAVLGFCIVLTLLLGLVHKQQYLAYLVSRAILFFVGVTFIWAAGHILYELEDKRPAKWHWVFLPGFLLSITVSIGIFDFLLFP